MVAFKPIWSCESCCICSKLRELDLNHLCYDCFTTPKVENLRSNKPYLCDECLKACSYSNDVKKTNYKPLKLHLKRLEDLPLIICSTTERITYRLCRLYFNGYYYKYVSIGLTASAWEDDILKVHSEENKRREIEEKRKAIKNESIRIENEILDLLKVRGVYN